MALITNILYVEPGNAVWDLLPHAKLGVSGAGNSVGWHRLILLSISIVSFISQEALTCDAR